MNADIQTILSTYIEAVAGAYATGKATEHSYRPAIKALVEALAPGVVATNEPKRIECGAPDVILAKDGVPVGFIETKVPFDDDLEGRGARPPRLGPRPVLRGWDVPPQKLPSRTPRLLESP